MKSTSSKNIVESIGIVAIVISLMLVAYEVRQNTLMMRAQTRDSMTEKQMTITEWVSTNEYTAKIAVLGGAGELEPGSPEHFSFVQLVQGFTREWENTFYQYEQGLFDQAEFEARRHLWVDVMRVKGIKDHWSRSKESYSPRFRAEIDRIVADNESESNSE